MGGTKREDGDEMGGKGRRPLVITGDENTPVKKIEGIYLLSYLVSTSTFYSK